MIIVQEHACFHSELFLVTQLIAITFALEHEHSARCPPKRPTLSLSISLPNIDQFSKFFRWHTLWIVGNNVVIKYFTEL